MTDTDLIATSAPAGSESGDNSQASSSASNGAVATSTKRAETRRGAGLSGMVLTELRTLAGELGIKGTSGMRKGDLIAAIKERQGAARRLHPHRVNSLSTTHPLRALVPRALAPHAPKPPQPKQLRQLSRSCRGRACAYGIRRGFRSERTPSRTSASWRRSSCRFTRPG